MMARLGDETWEAPIEARVAGMRLERRRLGSWNAVAARANEDRVPAERLGNNVRSVGSTSSPAQRLNDAVNLPGGPIPSRSAPLTELPRHTNRARRTREGISLDSLSVLGPIFVFKAALVPEG